MIFTLVNSLFTEGIVEGRSVETVDITAVISRWLYRADKPSNLLKHLILQLRLSGVSLSC